MSTSTITTSAANGGITPADTGPVRAPKSVLGQEDFLKLLTVQLSSQDPMKPMEDQAFIAQMAQFSSLEQMNTLTREFGELRSNQQLNSASSLIGRQVTVDTPDESVTGVVEAVDATASPASIVVNGKTYEMTAVRRISQPATLANGLIPTTSYVSGADTSPAPVPETSPENS